MAKRDHYTQKRQVASTLQHPDQIDRVLFYGKTVSKQIVDYQHRSFNESYRKAFK
ncbi:hypothetical protein NCCP133_33840 [Cytobacillus sp. NCCP-133]|nr:hypothetical protein NCCP133_33840 [Cytobacillus sp. NCCP-133]